MNIAFIVYFFPCLSETFILHQITGLLKQGHEIDIFARFNPNEDKVQSEVNSYNLMSRVCYIPKFKKSNLIFFALNKCIFRGLNYFYNKNNNKSFALIKFIKNSFLIQYFPWWVPFIGKKIDVVYCQFGQNGDIGIFLKNLGIKSKFVTMFHGSDIRLGIEKGGSIYKQLFKHGDIFFSISEYNYKHLVKFGAPIDKIIYHPIGIDLKMFPFKWKSEEVQCQDPIIVLTVARLVEEKGIKYGIYSIKELLEKIPEINIEYQIIGDGPLKKELENMVNTLNLNNYIRFLGSMDQEEIAIKMKKAHIFLLPSIAEALPTVLMEAQAIGLPIVATHVGSITEIIINKESGFIVPEGNVSAIVEKLEYLLNNSDKWEDMGRLGRKVVEEKYDINILNKKLIGIFKDIIIN